MKRLKAKHGLTHRQLDVMREIAKGYSDAKIATILNLSTLTVRDHVASILAKVGVENRTQAAIWALKQGIVA